MNLKNFKYSGFLVIDLLGILVVYSIIIYGVKGLYKPFYVVYFVYSNGVYKSDYIDYNNKMIVRCWKCGLVYNYRGERKPNYKYPIWINCKRCRANIKLILRREFKK
jgi:hypothetical protein